MFLVVPINAPFKKISEHVSMESKCKKIELDFKISLSTVKILENFQSFLPIHCKSFSLSRK